MLPSLLTMRVIPLPSLLLTLVLGCAPTQPIAAPPPLASPPAAVVTLPEAQAPLPPAPPSPARALRAAAKLGTPHGTPILISAQPGAFEDWLVLLGTATLARSACRVTLRGEHEHVDLVPNFPRGAKVIAHAIRRDRVALLLESAAVLDQPAGLRGVHEVILDGSTENDPAGRALALSQLREAKDLDARLSALELDRPAAMPQAQLQAWQQRVQSLLVAAAANTQQLAASLSSQGIDVQVLIQSTFLEPVANLTAASLATHPSSQALLETVQIADSNTCLRDWCTIYGSDGRVRSLQVIEESGQIKLRRLVMWGRPVAPPSPLQPPRMVEASPSHATSDTLVRELVSPVPEVLAEAPLGNGGVIAVLKGGSADSPVYTMLLSEGEFLGEFGMTSVYSPGVGPRIRFTDIDGDGRTDVVMQVTTTYVDKQIRWYEAFLAPRSVDAGDTSDRATMLAMLDKKDIDQAIRAAWKVPSRGASLAMLKQVIAGLGKPASLARVLAPGGTVLEYDEPAHPAYHYKLRRKMTLDAGDLEELLRSAEKAICSPTRPVCIYSEMPSTSYFWFDWVKGVPKLAGVALYTGS